MPVTELGLPESNLDLELPQNFNNHHNAWTRRRMGEFAITQTFRDLARHQFLMPRDTHANLHLMFDPPKFPTLEQAMGEVMEAYEAKEMMKVFLFDRMEYVYHPISNIHIRTLEAEYNSLK